MKNKFLTCKRCPAYHLLTEERIGLISKWENKKQNNIDRMKKIQLILLGESMPSKRYFYDIDTEYINSGMRFNLKHEFDLLELSDSAFLESFRKKGILLHDCALCPIHKLNSNAEKRSATTYCFLTQNFEFINIYKEVPIATIFPSNRGFLKSKIPNDIKNRIIADFGFNDVSGLKNLYLKIKNSER